MAASRVFFLLMTGVFAASAQTMYVASDIIVDESSGNVTVVASTSTDYSTAYYYDLFVQTLLTVQPQGSSSYTTCNNYRTDTSSYVSVSCSINLGSQSASLSLSSFHNLDVTYYYYQLQYCTWECYYWDDYYGFSLLGTSGTYYDNQYFLAPGQATPVAQKTSKSATVLKSKQKGGCFYPSSESTSGWGWNASWPYAAQFMQDLSGGSFNDRLITESFSGSPADHCYRPGNTGGPAVNPVPGTWNVRYIKAMDSSGYLVFYFTRDNAWGFDHVGFWQQEGSTRLSQYVQNMRPTSSSCSVDFYQNMYMYCGTGTNVGPGNYYTSGPLSIIISATPFAASITSIRKGVQQVRQYS
jgi:hypothetical protein